MSNKITPHQLRIREACSRGVYLAEKLLGDEGTTLTREFVIGMLMHPEARAHYGWLADNYSETPTLEGQDLSGVELIRGGFEFANCIATDFSGCNLDRSSFYTAELDYAEFVGASIFRGDFDSVNAYHTDFRDTWLYSAVFRHADLRGADFRGARLKDATFDHANLRKTKWEGAQLENVSFPGAYVDEDTKETLRSKGVEI